MSEAIVHKLPIKHKLNNLSDVLITAPANNEELFYELASLKWKNKALSLLLSGERAMTGDFNVNDNKILNAKEVQFGSGVGEDVKLVASGNMLNFQNKAGSVFRGFVCYDGTYNYNCSFKYIGDEYAVFYAPSKAFYIQAVGRMIHKPRAAPASPIEGEIYYDSTAKKFKFYNGTAWETITSV